MVAAAIEEAHLGSVLVGIVRVALDDRGKPSVLDRKVPGVEVAYDLVSSGHTAVSDKLGLLTLHLGSPCVLVTLQLLHKMAR